MNHLRVGRSLRGFVVAACFAFAAPVPADPDDGTLQITPYLWAAGLGGTIQPFAGAPAVRLDKSFGDLVRNLDAAFLLSAYARRDRWVYLADLNHTASSGQGSVPGAGLSARGALKQTSLSLATGYRLVHREELALDLLVGARGWWTRASVEVPVLGVAAARRTNFIDPTLGIRSRLDLSPRWSTHLHGEAGGFGVGSRSSVQATATLDRRLGESGALSVGLRYYAFDLRRAGGRVDVRASGPIAGATWVF